MLSTIQVANDYYRTRVVWRIISKGFSVSCYQSRELIKKYALACIRLWFQSLWNATDPPVRMNNKCYVVWDDLWNQLIEGSLARLILDQKFYVNQGAQESK